MDKYDVVGLLGEGSFGRVYKAKQTADSKYVALKVISKRGRSTKELKGLRRECEIQRYLHHPNIIQMLDSFETENEIVVITEFADKELNVILGKEGYLSEDRVQTIVWDLVSALYYLHSHRVLHRDLKPQNILLDSKNCAKLCDFGFARNMSTGTHVLTSIKGTPLYMAPELIEEQPYNHNADLWSLGCIIYELLVGTPPFSTVSILHLIRLIRHENIQWPTFISANCISFLKGLLQKNPAKRMTWPEILNHPFVKGHILISEDTPSMPLTRPVSVNTLQAKEQQKKDHITQKTQLKPKNNDLEVAEATKTQHDNKTSATTSATQSNETKKSDLQDLKNNNQTVCDKLKNLSLESTNKELKKSGDIKKTSESKDDSKKSTSSYKTKIKTTEESEIHQDFDTDLEKSQTLQTINIYEDSHPIESEEWIVFLLRSIEEVMSGEMASLCQQNLTNIIVSPLRNSNASPKVLSYAASLLSLPFTLKGISESTVEQIKKVYVEVKLVPNLIYASKLLMREKLNESGCNSSTSQSPTNTPISYESNRPTSDLKDEELQALEYIYLLICHLVHLDIQFLNQLCDSIVIINVYNLLHRLLLLSKKKLRIVIDLVAILTQILRKTPENNEIVDRIVSNNKNVNENEENVNFVDLLRHSNHLLRERTCYLILFLSKYTPQALEEIWNDKVKDTLEALVYDSMENVRNAAEKVVEELKHLHNFKTSIHSDIVQCNNSK